MNKISKKIVALATMAAFVLTLVPAAAFGAVSSSVEVQEKSKEVTLSTGASQSATAKVDINVGTGDAGSDIVVWVEKDKAFYSYAEFGGDAIEGSTLNANWDDYGVVRNVSANQKKTVEITFSEAGTYKVCAGISKNQAAETPDDLRPLGVSDEDGTIVVSKANSYVSEIAVEGADTTTQGQNGGTINYAGGAPNGVRSTTVVAQLTSVYENDPDTTVSSEGKVLNVENPYSNFTISNADGVVSDENPIVADENSEATFYVKATAATRAGTYTLTLKADNAEYRLSIVIGSEDNEAATIEAVDTGRTALNKADLTGTSGLTIDSVAQFTVKNAAGDILTPDDNPTGFSAYNANSGDVQNETVGLVSAPEEGKDATFKVVKSEKNSDNFALRVVDPSKLAVGEYTVRVALDNNKSADVTFTVARFGQVVDTVIEFTDDKGNVVTEVVDNETKYTAKILQIDENGLTREVAANMGYTGAALQIINTDASKGELTFTVNDDVNANDNSLVGSTIGVWGFTTAYGQYAYGEVTVADEANIFDYTLAFDSTNGPAGEDNTVGVTVVDADGDKVDVDNADLYVYLLDKSVDDANVYVAPKNVKVNDGEGKLIINSDKETELEIIVGVRNSDNVIFANTLNYTVGAQDPNADTTVVMTIGSTEYVVNNDFVNGDAAPYIDSAWRTMVPVRVLAETLGGTVDYTDNVITIVDGDTTIVMTVGEDTYTVNDEEQTMDTAPVIGEGDRTFVPVRFLAEALGYTVVPLQDANGLTASVVFQK